MYVTSNLNDQNVRVETVVAAFTDHLAVCLLVNLEAPLLQRGQDLWKMNRKVLEVTTIRSRFQQERTMWKLQEGKYPDMVTWWEKYVRRKIHFLFTQEGTARAREDMIKEIFHYACIYDILKDRKHPREKTPTLNYHKAKIIRLHRKRVQSIITDTQEAALFQGESPSLFHLLQVRKRRVSRMITSIIDKGGVTQTTSRGILHTFVAFL